MSSGSGFLFSKINNPKSKIQNRIGGGVSESNQPEACSHNLTNGFEDRAHHRTGCASAMKNVLSNLGVFAKFCQVFSQSF